MTAYRVLHDTRYRYADPVVISHNEAHLLPRALATPDAGSQLAIDPAPDSGALAPGLFGNTSSSSRSRRRTASSRSAPRATSSSTGAALDPARSRAVGGGAAARAARAHARGARRVRVRVRLAVRAPRARRSPPTRGRRSRPAARSPRPCSTSRAASTPSSVRPRGHHGRHAGRGRAARAPRRLPGLRAPEIGCLRSLGLPARYVSGYLQVAPQPKPARREGELVGADASHAWVAVWCPTLGWIDVDPDQRPRPERPALMLAWGRDYDDVSP